MVEILDDIRADTELTTATRWEDANKIRDGVMLRANKTMIRYGSQWKVNSVTLQKQTAEMTNAVGNFQNAIPNPRRNH